MARREDIVNTIWDDLEDLSNPAMLLYVWSWTNPRCGMAGIYRVSRKKLLEGRLGEEQLDSALAELEAAGLVRYVDGVLWNCARVKRLSGLSENYAKSIFRDVKEVADSPLATEFWGRYGGHPRLKGLPTHSDGFAKGSDGLVEPNEKGSAMGSGTHHGPGHGQGHGFREFGSSENESVVSPYDAKTIKANV